MAPSLWGYTCGPPSPHPTLPFPEDDLDTLCQTSENLTIMVTPETALDCPAFHLNTWSVVVLELFLLQSAWTQPAEAHLLSDQAPCLLPAPHGAASSGPLPSLPTLPRKDWAQQETFKQREMHHSASPCLLQENISW